MKFLEVVEHLAIPLSFQKVPSPMVFMDLQVSKLEYVNNARIPKSGYIRCMCKYKNVALEHMCTAPIYILTYILAAIYFSFLYQFHA